MFVALNSTEAEVRGSEFEFQGVLWRLARAGTKKYRSAYDRISAPYKRKIRRGKLSSEDEHEIFCRTLAEVCLLGWRDPNGGPSPLKDSNGEPVEYSKENAYLILYYNDEIRAFVVEMTTEEANWQRQEAQARGKESPSTLSGTENTMPTGENS